MCFLLIFLLFYVCGDSRRLAKRQFRKMCVAKRNRVVLGEPYSRRLAKRQFRKMCVLYKPLSLTSSIKLIKIINGVN